MIEQQAMRMALEALESCGWNHGYMGDNQYFDDDQVDKAITALRQALEQAEMVQSIEAKLAYKEWCKSNNWISFPEWISKQQPVERTADEPVAYLDDGLGTFYWPKEYKKDVGFTPLYTRPQPAAWVGLTEQEQGAIMEDLNAHGANLYHFAEAIETKLKEKNT